jgi:hypothetical protein
MVSDPHADVCGEKGLKQTRHEEADAGDIADESAEEDERTEDSF